MNGVGLLAQLEVTKRQVGAHAKLPQPVYDGLEQVVQGCKAGAVSWLTISLYVEVRLRLVQIRGGLRQMMYRGAGSVDRSWARTVEEGEGTGLHALLMKRQQRLGQVVLLDCQTREIFRHIPLADACTRCQLTVLSCLHHCMNAFPVLTRCGCLALA